MNVPVSIGSMVSMMNVSTCVTLQIPSNPKEYNIIPNSHWIGRLIKKA